MHERGGIMPRSKGGRPPKYTSKEQIEGLIEDYFKECEGVPFFDDDGKPLVTDKGYVVYKIHPKPPTVTGLALALGFNSRQALLNYQGKKEFNDTITRAKSYVEEYAERRLFDRDGVQGAKFSLINNFKGWTENKKENDHDENRLEDDPITKALKEEFKDGVLR
mgnify:FL=1